MKTGPLSFLFSWDDDGDWEIDGVALDCAFVVFKVDGTCDGPKKGGDLVDVVLITGSIFDSG